MPGSTNFRRRRVILAIATAAACSFAEIACGAASPEVRGTWVTTTGLSTGTVATPSATETNFKKLHDIGLNSIYMDAWRAGYTYFSSPTLKAIVGTDHAPETGSRDLLQETLIQSHRNGMAQISWFQYGFATYFGNPGSGANSLTNYMKAQGWLLQDASGNYTNSTNSFSWMNPLVPQVQQFVTGIVTDAVKKYDIDGIQFDDRLAWPYQFGYDTYTRNQYKAEHGGADVPSNPSDPTFLAWRAAKLKAFTLQLQSAVKAVNPNVIFSLAPTVYPTAYNNYCVNWPDWAASGMLDEYVPQVYRRNATDFDTDWDGPGAQTNGGQVQFVGSRAGDFAAGIAIDGSGWTAPFTPNGVNEEIAQVRSTTVQGSHVAGQVLWYSNGVLNTYPSQLTSLYDVADNGPAARPDEPANWRPPSTVATSAAGGRWNINVATAGLYDIITESNGIWSIFDTRLLPLGSTSVPVSGASAVEIIVDHRPASLFTTTSWNADADGNASAGGNWSFGVVPGGVDTTLRFGYVITAPRTVTLDTAITTGSLLFDNSASYTIGGSGASLTLQVSSGASTVTVNSGNHTISAPLNLLSSTTFSVPTGSNLSVLQLASATVAVTKTGAGVLRLNHLSSPSLQISAGTVQIVANGTATGVSRINSLNIANGSQLDLTDNNLITSAIVGTVAGSTYSGVTGLVQAGRNGGAWNGATGIVTSESAAASGNLTSIGVASALDIRPATATTTVVWAGQTISSSDTLVMYTHGGDATLDGKINVDDYIRIDNGIAAGLTGWSNGDFNYDGKVNIDDYTQFIDANINIQGPPFATSTTPDGKRSLVAIPEPATSMLVAVLSASAIVRRRRRDHCDDKR